MKKYSRNLKITVAVLCLTFITILISCSQPKLEAKQCIESRDVIKKFYSFHIGNNMKPSAENIGLRSEFLTAQLEQELAKQTGSDKDYFTQTDDYPKTFRIGECAAGETGEAAKFQVLLFWKDDTRSEQREILVEMKKQNKNWLISKVEKKN